MRLFFIPGLHSLSPQCPGLNLAYSHDASTYSRPQGNCVQQCWDVTCLPCRKRKAKVTRDEKKFIWAQSNTPAEQKSTFTNPISSLLCFFCSPPLDLFHPLLLLQTGVSFFFSPSVSTLQPGSQRQVLLSYYLIIEEHLFSPWHSERPVTFMEAQLC